MSLTLATGYMTGLAVVFGTFAYCYHKRKTMASSVSEGWFPQHATRDQYYDLLDQEQEASAADLKTALLRRAMEDVGRIYELREQKPSLSTLVRSGQIGEDVWSQFVDAEAEMEQELMEVVQEAERLKEGWGQQIFQTASEMVMHERQKEQEREMEEMKREQEQAEAAVAQREQVEQAEAEVAEEVRAAEERERLANELIREEEEEAARKRPVSRGKGKK